MNPAIRWMAAQAERPQEPEFQGPLGRKPPRRAESLREETVDARKPGAHQFPARRADEVAGSGESESQNLHPVPARSTETRMGPPGDEHAAFTGTPLPVGSYCDPSLRAYRGRTVAMLRRYMRYSIETGRLPSLLGREFFRAKVTSYSVVTFEDRVIFVHDMETCLERLDEFSRQIIARHILQEHDRRATAKLLHCNEKTIRRLTPIALDLLSEILLERGMLDQLNSVPKIPVKGVRRPKTL